MAWAGAFLAVCALETSDGCDGCSIERGAIQCRCLGTSAKLPRPICHRVHRHLLRKLPGRDCETLSDTLKAQGIEGDVVAVVIDEAEAPELLKSDHYKHASRAVLVRGK